jgi:MFS transporter, PAT family, beta-lactamase induction signal transducer AmpG
MHHQKSRNFLFLLFAMLYFVQGVITSYQLNFLKPHMSAEGIEADRLALLATLALVPFIIKFLYGLISDRFNFFGYGHRVPYMVIGVLVCSLAFFIAYFVDPGQSFGLVAGLILVAVFGMALFDTTADAYAIEIMPPEDHSRVQSFMTGGRATGLIILSFVFGILAARFGFSVIFLVISAILLLPLIMLFQVKEPEQRSAHLAFDWSAFRVMLHPNYLLWALFLVLSWFAFQGIDGLVTFYMSSDLGASETTLGNYGTLKGIGMVIGAVGLSLIASKINLKAAAFTTLVLVTIGGFALSLGTRIETLLILGLGWGIVVGLQWTSYAALTMGITDLRIAGSMFALFQMMANIGIASGEGIATSLSDNIGFTGVFRLLAIFNLLLIPILIFILARFAGKPDAVAETPVELFDEVAVTHEDDVIY